MTMHALAALLLGALACACAAAQPAVEVRPGPWKVAVLVYDEAALIDLAGPLDVFAHAGEMWRIDGRPAFEIFTVGPGPGAVRLAGGVRLLPDHALRDSPRADIVVLPGGAHAPLAADALFMASLGKLLADADIRLAICNAPMLLGELRYLDGIRATSSVNGGLRRRYPRALVVDDVRVVDAGSVITTATGVAGMDGALGVVARLLDRESAKTVAEHLAYNWRPDGNP
jgi:transcriptional regulator GlxA family with amidase domain